MLSRTRRGAQKSKLEPSPKEADNAAHGLDTDDQTLAQPPAGGAGPDSPGPPAAEGGAEHGVRGRAGGPAHAGAGTRPPRAATRYLNTALGVLSYAELAPHLATRVQALQSAIAGGDYDRRTLDENLLLEFHRRICADLIPGIAGLWRTTDVVVGDHEPPAYPLVSQRMREYALDLQARLASLPQEPDDLWLETLAFDHRPYRIEIDAKVTADESVAGTRYLLPWHTRLTLKQIAAQVLHGLAQDLDLPDHRALHHGVGNENPSSASGKTFDRRDGLQHLRQVEFISAIHKGRASARMRSFKRGCSSASVHKSTFTPSASSISSCNAAISSSEEPGRTFTRRSRSLSSRSAHRATDPNTRTLLAPRAVAMARTLSRYSERISEGRMVGIFAKFALRRMVSTISLKFEAASSFPLIAWSDTSALRYGAQVEVLAPESLRQAVLLELEAAVATYRDNRSRVS